MSYVGHSRTCLTVADQNSDISEWFDAPLKPSSNIAGWLVLLVIAIILVIVFKTVMVPVLF